jgi:hypothetical protein
LLLQRVCGMFVASQSQRLLGMPSAAQQTEGIAQMQRVRHLVSLEVQNLCTPTCAEVLTCFQVFGSFGFQKCCVTICRVLACGWLSWAVPRVNAM